MKIEKKRISVIYIVLFACVLISCISAPKYDSLGSSYFPAKVKALTFNSDSGLLRLDESSQIKKGAWTVSFPANKKPTATYEDRGCQSLVFVKPLVCRNKVEGTKSCSMLYELSSSECGANFRAKCYMWITGQKTPADFSCDDIIFE